MKKNLSNTDRLVRVLIAAIVAVLYFTGNIYGTPGILLLVAAGVLFATTLIGFCQLYAMLGISSCKVKKTGSAV